MEEVCIRQARAEDYDAVMAINHGVYMGRDYLPEFYHDMLANENILCLVACVHSEVVGFTSGLVIDDGKAVIRRCGRLHESVQNKGIYKTLMLRLRQHLQEAFPNLTSERVVLCDRSAGKGRQSLMENEVYRVNIATFKKDISNTVTFPKLDWMTSPVYDVNENEFRMVLSNQEFVTRMFPKYITCFWKPFSIEEGNISQMLRENTGVISSKKLQPDNLHEIKALTFYTTYPCAVGNLCHVDIYGDNNNNSKRHLVEVVQKLCELQDEKVIFLNIYYHGSVNAIDLESFMVSLGFERTKGITELIILDKNIENTE